MANSVENVYSTALFELCEEQDILESTYDELEQVCAIVFDGSQKDFVEMLSSPLIPFEDKQKVLESCVRRQGRRYAAGFSVRGNAKRADKANKLKG